MLTDPDHGTKYPTSDGKPMAETDVHRDQIIALILTLQDHFQGRPDVYVTGNLLMFYEQGNGRRHLSPDVMVVFGVDKKQRDNYKLWEEKAPDAVFEITSKSTRDEDMGRKMELYARHGVREYYVFDPMREYIPAGLRSYRLEGGQYVPVVGEEIRSEVLGLTLRIVDGVLRLYDPQSGVVLMVHEELVEKWRTAEARAEAAEVTAEAAVAHVEAERQRADAERQRADAERQRADAERQRADAERERADAALRELQEIRRKLREEP